MQAADLNGMRPWITFVLIALLATACTATTSPDEARELIFEAEAPSPTVVSPAVAVETTTTINELPARLAFSEWTVDELIVALEAALDGPATVTFTGQGGTETLEIDGSQWRVASGDFATRGVDEDEWVTYGHVGVGIRSKQAFNAELDAGEAATQTAQIDRFVIDETSDLATMWVPYVRDSQAFFAPSILYPAFVEELLTEVTRAVAAAETSGILETTSTDTTFTAEIPGTDFVSVSVTGDELLLSSLGGWTITMVSGVDDSTDLGSPDARDILDRDRLLTATQVPEECIALEIEARSLVDTGLVTCTDPQQLIELTAAIVTDQADDTE